MTVTRLQMTERIKFKDLHSFKITQKLHVSTYNAKHYVTRTFHRLW